MLLGMLNLYDKIPDNIKLSCPIQVRQRIIEDIDSELNILTSKSSGGYLGYVDGNLTLTRYDNESKRERYKYLTYIKNFVSHLSSSHAFNFTSDIFDLQSILVENNLHCENGCLGYAQNIENTVLVTDEQFLYSIADLSHLKNIGICSFLAVCHIQWDILLEVSQKLSKMNFGNYLPASLYIEIIDQITKDLSQKKDVQSLVNWLLSDNKNGDASEYHCEVIIQLFRDVNNIMDYARGNSKILREIALGHYETLHPGSIQKYINNFIKKMSIEPELENNESEKPNNIEDTSTTSK
jgi:hypothetical protein